MGMPEQINEMEEYLFHVYDRFPIVFERGEGVYLYDTDGKAYLDMAAGIGVMAFGYGHKAYTDALKKQMDTLTHTSNLFYHTPLLSAARSICRASGMDKVFFTNSGAEAIEGALKTAKKYAYNKESKGSYEIVALSESFHGRTIGALSVTGNEHYREPFAPLMDGVRFAKQNDIESVKAAVTDKTCAIIMEPVQGEGGIIPATKEFLQAVRDICDQNDILLIFDEVQCGMGRSGHMFVWQKYGIRPDILTTAKMLGAGAPVGAFLVTKKVAEASLVPGDHGTTYGGNPFVCAAVEASISLMESLKIPEHVNQLTPFFEEILDGFVEKYSFIKARRGVGFMQGLVLDESVPVGDIVKAGHKEGIILLSAGGNVLRFLPPLICEKKDFIKMQEILDKLFLAR